ncbi:MAG: hypothetical protein HY867_00130 [Chloroflexi bacterium]|nr:hypothetical protein [Chloroflexota bacterium]
MRLSDLLIIFKNPRVAAITGVILGLALGLSVGWGLWPVEYFDTAPSSLRQDFKEQYLRMAIDSYHSNNNEQLAVQRWGDLGTAAPDVLFAIQSAPGDQRPGWIQEYKTLIEGMGLSTVPSGTGGSAEPINGEPTETPAPGGASSLMKWGLAIFSVIAIGVIIGAGVYYVRRILYGKPSVQPSGEVSAARQAQEIAKSTEKTDFQTLGLAKPITQTMTTYVLGDDLYDESFSIDAASGDFLGEYGVGVSETMVSGEPKKVTAIEIWLFDKNDIKTATKVLMSGYSFNDPTIRARLEAKGELALMEKDKQVMLETQTLQLLATVVDLEYGQSNLPEKSYFERVTLELAVWPKKKSA